MVRVTYNMLEAGSGRKFRVVGTGVDLATARGEADAKVAMTVGTIVDALASDVLPTPAVPNSAAGLFSDAVLTLRNSGGKFAVVRLDNVTTAIGTGVNGLVNSGNALVSAFVTAYRDGTGGAGYLFYDGHFVK